LTAAPGDALVSITSSPGALGDELNPWKCKFALETTPTSQYSGSEF
jgi:hypothetical protein